MKIKRHTKTNSAIVAFLKSVTQIMRGTRAQGYYYNTVEQLLLEEGKAFRTHHTKQQAKQLTNLFQEITDGGRYTIRKQCYHNCQLALLHNYTDTKLQYVEGYGYDPNLGVPLPHAFLVVNDKVFDPTWFKHTNGIPTDDMQYYGIRINEKDLIEGIRRTDCTNSHLDNYWAGFEILRNKFNNNKPYLQ